MLKNIFSKLTPSKIVIPRNLLIAGGAAVGLAVVLAATQHIKGVEIDTIPDLDVPSTDV